MQKVMGKPMITQAIQKPINFAMTMGAGATTADHKTPYLGTEVFFPPGDYLITKPLILPPSANSGRMSVHLRGANARSTCIIGHQTKFPENRGLIEWSVKYPDTVTGDKRTDITYIFVNYNNDTGYLPALYQRISNLCLQPPALKNAMAIFRPFPKLKDQSFRSIRGTSGEYVQGIINELIATGNLSVDRANSKIVMDDLINLSPGADLEKFAAATFPKLSQMSSKKEVIIAQLKLIGRLWFFKGKVFMDDGYFQQSLFPDKTSKSELVKAFFLFF